ncbi:MAG: ATP-binding cassette domain-containing protein [Woeseia sp.]
MTVAGDNCLAIRQLSLRVDGQMLFRTLDLAVAPGTVVVVTGPSGAGKSSLLAFLCGTLPPEFDAQGAVWLDGDDISRLPPEKRGLGILFQEPLLFPHLSVRGNLLFGLREGDSRKTRRLIVDRELDAMGLAGFGDRDPVTLSGGQKARVALLRVLLARPRALLLDEPFLGLDDANRAKVRQLVFDEIRRRQLPTLLVTHDRDDVACADGPVVALTRP